MRIAYRYSETKDWRYLQIADLQELQITTLWRGLETFSGVLYLRCRGRYCTLYTTMGQAQMLCKDVLYYMLETKSFKGIITYQDKGTARWKPDVNFFYKLSTPILLISWTAVSLLGCPYMPIWFLAIMSYIKYRQTK